MTGINVTEALARFDNDREIYLELIDTYLETGVPDFAEMAKALSAGNGDEVGKSIHRLKGGALTVGADDLAAAAGKFESALRSGSKENLATILGEIERLSNEALISLESIREELRKQS